VSQENVDLTLLIVDAWNRRDVEAVIALSDPEIVWSPAFEGSVEGRPYRGHAGMRQDFEGLAEFSEESHAEFTEVHDLGDQVLGLGRVWFTFAGGVRARSGGLWPLDVARRKVRRRPGLARSRRSREALEAAGLQLSLGGGTRGSNARW
jgi:ketosteroid isomerase-like protein